MSARHCATDELVSSRNCATAGGVLAVYVTVNGGEVTYLRPGTGKTEERPESRQSFFRAHDSY